MSSEKYIDKVSLSYTFYDELWNVYYVWFDMAATGISLDVIACCQKNNIV
jgi:hypothetical protein